MRLVLCWLSNLHMAHPRLGFEGDGQEQATVHFIIFARTLIALHIEASDLSSGMRIYVPRALWQHSSNLAVLCML